MIERLKQLISGAPVSAGLLEQRESMELVTAALLVELARSDFATSPSELSLIKQLLVERFGLNAEAADGLLQQAVARADQAVSLHEFTHRLNRELDADNKLAIVRMLWRLSRVDNQLDKHEEQLVKRVAGLLHVSDRDLIRIKHEG